MRLGCRKNIFGISTSIVAYKDLVGNIFYLCYEMLNMVLCTFYKERKNNYAF